MNKLPTWVVPALIAIIGVAVAWGKVTADVGSINKRIDKYDPLVESVAKLSVEVPNLSRRVDEIYIGQSEIQKDIKQLLRNTRET